MRKLFHIPTQSQVEGTSYDQSNAWKTNQELLSWLFPEADGSWNKDDQLSYRKDQRIEDE